MILLLLPATTRVRINRRNTLTSTLMLSKFRTKRALKKKRTLP